MRICRGFRRDPVIVELWWSRGEGSHLFLPRTSHYEMAIGAHRDATPDLVLEWICDASSYNEAQQARYDYLALGTYKPEPSSPDTFYND